MPGPLANNRDSLLTRRHFVLSLTASLGFCGVAAAAGARRDGPIDAALDIYGQVTPDAGINTGVSFGDSIQKLIASGALDPTKLRSLGNGLPEWVEQLLKAPSAEPILFNRDTASYLVDLLWPLGLSTRTAFNKKSPINTLRIPTFASTGGWTLGRENNGYIYFNEVNAIKMTARQEALALDVATNSFRPCCDNSTFYQDCNHGSALLGLIELAASQGATLDRLYRIALAANSYWFPEQYAKTALYFSHFENRSWSDVAPQQILGADFSSLSGWQRNVDDRLLQANVKLPADPRVQPACGI